MGRSAARVLFLSLWTLAMVALLQQRTEARLGPADQRTLLDNAWAHSEDLMDPALWQPAGDLLSRTFPSTSIAWADRAARFWTLPGGDIPREAVEHRGRRLPNHQQFSARTRQRFQAFHLQLDFRFEEDGAVPKRLQDFGNSGIYVYGLYEVQLLDTSRFLPPRAVPPHMIHHGMVEVGPVGRAMRDPANTCLCGSIYGGGVRGNDAPLAGAASDAHGRPTNFCKPSGRWNRLEIDFAPARFADGRKTHLATIAMSLNGRRVYFDGQPKYGIPGPTGSQAAQPERTAGPIVLQDHGGKVSFRNMRINAAWRPPGDWLVAADSNLQPAVLAAHHAKDE